MKTINVKYYLTTFECKHHRPKLTMKYNCPDNIDAVTEYLTCYTCGRMGGMRVLEQAKKPSYSVPVSV